MADSYRDCQHHKDFFLAMFWEHLNKYGIKIISRQITSLCQSSYFPFMLKMMSTVFCVGSKPPSHRVRVAIQWPQVCVPLCSLARFVLGRPKFKSSATLVNYSQLVASCQLGIFRAAVRIYRLGCAKWKNRKSPNFVRI